MFCSFGSLDSYTAMNYNQSPLGNSPFYGTYHAIMRPSYMAEGTYLTPTDSYHYETQYPNCVQWKNCTVGTME